MAFKSLWAALLLTLCFGANAAEQFDYRRCPDGSAAPRGQLDTYCPKIISLAGISSVTSTTATVSVNVTGTNGSVYLYLLTTDTGRSWQTVRRGTGAAKHSGAIAVSAAQTYSYSFSGLTANTTYHGQAVYVPTAGKPTRVLRFSFKSLVDDTPPGTALTGRFIDCNAAAGGNGTTSALSGANGAWDSIEDLEQNQGSLTAGTDVWFRSGCDFGYDTDRQGWYITHGGVDSTNHAVFGAYYLDPANSNAPTAVWQGSLGGRLQWNRDEPNYKKIGPPGSETLEPFYVTGTLDRDDLEVGLARFTGGFPPECLNPQVMQINFGGSYITVRGLMVRYSHCIGGGAWNLSLGGAPQEDKVRESWLMDSGSHDNGHQNWIHNVGHRHPFMSYIINENASHCSNQQQRGGLSGAQFEVNYTSGGPSQIAVNDRIRGATSGKTLRIQEISLTSGSWAAGTAAGVLYVTETVGSGDMTASETLNRTSPTVVTDIATLGATITTTGGVQHVLRPRNPGLVQNCGKSGGSTAGPLGVARGGGWTGSFLIARSVRAYGVVEAMGSYGSAGECFNPLMSTHVTVRGLVCTNSLSAAYQDGSSDIVWDGLVSHDNGKLLGGYPNSNAFGSGLLIGYEDVVNHPLLGDNDNNIIRNSIFANADPTGAVFGVQFQSTHRRTGIRPKRVGYHLANNAFIAVNNRAITDALDVDTAAGGASMYNNLVDESSSSLTSICRPDLVANYNAFTKTASNTNFNECKGANDVNSSAAIDPLLARNPVNNTTNRDHWRTRGVANGLIDPDDAKPLAGSPLLNAGTATPSTTVGVANHTAYDRTWSVSTYPYALDTAQKRTNFAKIRYYDRNGVAATANVDIGPFEGTGTEPTPETQPSVSVSPNGRYLRWNGSPSIMVGCTGWRIKTITSAKVTQWLEAEAARGCQIAQAGSPAQTDDAWPPYTTNDLFCNASETTGCDTGTSNPRMRSSWFSGVGNLDHFVSETKRLGMIAAIPLAFGSSIDRLFCVDGAASAAPSCSATTWATNYATWIAQRYAAEKHIMWIVAGEYSKVAWEVNPTTHAVTQNTTALTANQLAVINAAANALQTHSHASTLVTIHPDSGYNYDPPGKGSSRGHFSNESWLNFSMLQAGDNNVNRVNTDRDYALTPVMPVLQGELNYESTDVNDAEDSPWHVRMGAWTHVLSGGAGYTYGHTAVWDFNAGWEEYLPGGATPAVGADDIYTHFKTFWATYHDESNAPARNLITSGAGSSAVGTDTYLSVLKKGDSSVLIAYAPKGNTFSLNTNALSGSIRARWFNPRTGAYTSIADPLTKSASTSFDPPNTAAVDNDYVLVLD